MADDPAGIFSVRTILANADEVANWVMTVAVAGGVGTVASFADKLTGFAIFVSISASAMLALLGWPILLQFGYGGLGFSMAYALVCGVGGMTLLLLLIGIIRRFYSRKDNIADNILARAGIKKEPQQEGAE